MSSQVHSPALFVQQAIAGFLDDFVADPASCQSGAYLVNLRDPILIEQHSALSTSVQAVAICFLATRSGSTSLHPIARRSYHFALNQVQLRLNHEIERPSYETFAAVFLLGLYEVSQN
jgi:hypothetical protein